MRHAGEKQRNRGVSLGLYQGGIETGPVRVCADGFGEARTPRACPVLQSVDQCCEGDGVVAQ